MNEVLIVDAMAATREVLRLVLENAGYTVTEASDGRTALAALRATSTRMIVLLDARMPDMSGFDLLAAVRADRELAARHAYVLLTPEQQALAEQASELLRQLSVRLVHKPFAFAALTGTVAQLVRRDYVPHGRAETTLSPQGGGVAYGS